MARHATSGVVLARVDDGDGSVLSPLAASGLRRLSAGWRRPSPRPPARRCPWHASYSRNARPVCDEGWRASSSGVPVQTTRPPASPPSGPRSISQSPGADHVEVCSRPAANARRPAACGARASAWRCRQMQAGGGLVEQIERALLRDGPAPARPPRPGWPASFRRCASPPTAWHRLAPASRSPGRRRRWAGGAQHLAVVAEQLHRLADGQLQHVGDAEVRPRSPGRARSSTVEDLGAVALAVAIRAAQVDVDRNCISTCSKPEPPQVGGSARRRR